MQENEKRNKGGISPNGYASFASITLAQSPALCVFQYLTRLVCPWSVAARA